MNDSPANKDRKFLCILRKTEEGIPNFETMEDTIAEMPQYFFVNTCSGKFLHGLYDMAVRAAVPLVEKQFREPVQKKVLHDSSEEIVAPTSSGDFKRPSDYRKMSVILQKSKESKSKMGINMSLSQTSEQDVAIMAVDKTALKNEFIADINVLIDTIAWTIEHVEDDSQQLMFDCPEIYDKSDNMIVKNRKILENLEEVIMSWERHITKVIEVYLAKVYLVYY